MSLVLARWLRPGQCSYPIHPMLLCLIQIITDGLDVFKDNPPSAVRWGTREGGGGGGRGGMRPLQAGAQGGSLHAAHARVLGCRPTTTRPGHFTDRCGADCELPKTPPPSLPPIPPPPQFFIPVDRGLLEVAKMVQRPGVRGSLPASTLKGSDGPSGSWAGGWRGRSAGMPFEEPHRGFS